MRVVLGSAAISREHWCTGLLLCSLFRGLKKAEILSKPMANADADTDDGGGTGVTDQLMMVVAVK